MLTQPYHHAWLSIRPHRTEEWLKEKLCEGFDIHHIDGNHENNDPYNLVLIEASDHMMMHNGKKPFIRVLGPQKGKRGPHRPPNERRLKRVLALNEKALAEYLKVG